MAMHRRCLSTSIKPVLRVAVAGGGIAGCILASQLRKEPGVQVDVYEARNNEVLPPGLNLLLNHNAMSALRDTDPALEAAMRGDSQKVHGWQARTMTGKVHYNIPDSTAAGLADGPGMMARWDMVYNVVRDAARESMHWGDAVDSYRYTTTDDGHHHPGGGAEEAPAVEASLASSGQSVGADLLVACDGRYSAVRQHMEGGSLAPPQFGVDSSSPSAPPRD